MLNTFSVWTTSLLSINTRPACKICKVISFVSLSGEDLRVTLKYRM